MYICPGLALTENRRLLSAELGELLPFGISQCLLEPCVSTGICTMEAAREQRTREKNTVFFFVLFFFN